MYDDDDDDNAVYRCSSLASAASLLHVRTGQSICLRNGRIIIPSCCWQKTYCTRLCSVL